MTCKRTSFLLILLSCFAFCDCKNFLNGDDFLTQLEDSINYANTPSASLLITTDYGTVLNNGERTVKKGDSVQLGYSEGTSGYQFVKWNVEPSESVSFIDEDGIICDSTSIKIENTSRKITIKPVLYERPKIDTTKNLPAFVKSGVEKNSSIYFTFTKKLSPDNDFKRISIEMVSSVEGQNTKLFGNEDSALDNFMLPTVDNYELTIAAKRDNYISLMNDVETIRVTIPGDFYYEVDGNKICFGAEQTYSYIINNQTVEKLEVDFACDGGSITPNIRTTYSISSNFEVVYTKLDDYIYKDWSVIVGGYIVEKCPDDDKDITGYYKAWLKSESGEKIGNPITFLSYNKPNDATRIILESQNMYKIEFSVLENLSGVSIKPKTILIPKISDYEPKYVNTGNDYDTNINVYFNKEMDVNTFTTSNIEIKDNHDKKDYSKYFSFKSNTDNGKTTLTIVPSYDIKELFTASKTQIDIEISLKNGIKDLDGESVSGNLSWHYRVINQAEKVNPVITDIHLYSDSDPKAYFYRELTQKQIGNWSKESEYDKNVPTTLLQYGDYSRNHVSKVYIDVQGYDVGGGISFIRVKEIYNNEEKYTDYNFNGDLIETKDGNEIYENKILHNFKTKNDGFLELYISFFDKAGNESNKQQYYLKKDNKVEFSVRLLFNEIYNVNESFSENDFIDNNLQLKCTLLDNSCEYAFSKGSEQSGPLYPYVQIYLNDEFLYEGIGNINEDDLNDILKKEKINNSINNYLKIVYSLEEGLTETKKLLLPKFSKIAQVKDTDDSYEFYIIDNQYNDDSYEVEYLFYYLNNNNEYDEINCGKENKIEKTYLWLDNFNNVEFLVVTIIRDYSFCFYSLPRKFIYKKEATNGNNGTLPQFSVNERDIQYQQNSSNAKITVKLDEVNLYDNQYQIKCVCEENNYVKCFSEKTFFVPNGYEYKISIITQDDDYNICESEPINVKTKSDNFPPSFNGAEFNVLDQFAPNFYRIKTRPYDINENRKSEDISKVYFFIPNRDTDIYSSSISTPIPNTYYQNEENITNIIEDSKKIELDCTNGYYDVPHFNNNMILYIEDETGNYNSALCNIYVSLIDSLPTITFISDKKYNIVIPDNVKVPDTDGYWDMTMTLFYTIQKIDNNETAWSFINEQTKFNKTDESNWRSKEIDLDVEKNSFIRLYTRFAAEYYDVILEHGTKFLIPLYICPAYLSGEISCNSHSWLEVPNGYQIFADSPTLCHTMFAPTKLTETNTTEDAYVWESKAMETGILVKDSMFTYSNDQTDGVPEGFYYATICHFADGTILMSDVRQK